MYYFKACTNTANELGNMKSTRNLNWLACKLMCEMKSHLKSLLLAFFLTPSYYLFSPFFLKWYETEALSFAN